LDGNPVHEERARRVIESECPGSTVVTGSSVDPQEREYERTSTAVVNALLKPLFSRYMEKLLGQLRDSGFKGSLLVMQSSGGIASPGRVTERPAAFIESGPAAGAVAVAYLARVHGVRRAVGFDMGGTTAKASSIVEGEPLTVDEYEVGAGVHMGRVLKGSGYPVRYPHIDLVEVGAGGGTIAWVDMGGAIRVGPVSAGSDPGPACYGRGGSRPTVTDANLLLGRIPGRIAGGRISLRRDLALKAFSRLADETGLDVVEAAWSVVRIANTIMGRALRLVTLERGYDAREFKLYAFGGAGPLHAVEVAGEVGVSTVVIPPYPGVFSALGLLVVDYRLDLYRAIMLGARDRSAERVVERVLEELAGRAVSALAGEGVGFSSVRVTKSLDMRYRGQAYTLTVPYRGSLAVAAEDFERLHEARYGYRLPGEEVVVVNARVTAYGLTPKPRLQLPRPRGRSNVRPSSSREVFYPREGWLKTPVYDVQRLAPGARIEGPAVIEAPDSTMLIPPGYSASVAGDLSVWIRPG
jgi:N-methylhydantoinase A